MRWLNAPPPPGVTPGVAALGPTFQPLPTGSKLREYWLDRLPKGERDLFAIIIHEYPGAISREALQHRTGYKRTSTNEYLRRLISRRLIVTERGAVSASSHLYGK